MAFPAFPKASPFPVETPSLPRRGGFATYRLRTIIDRDIKELYVGATAIFIFALVLVWLQQ
jgi:hypothetical protein